MLSKMSSYIDRYGCIFISYLILQRKIYVVASVHKLVDKGTGYEGIALPEKDSLISLLKRETILRITN